MRSPGLPAVLRPNETYAQLLASSVDPITPAPTSTTTSAPARIASRRPIIAPRLGFRIDINADQQYVVFGGYGRSYDRNFFNTLSYETTKVASVQQPADLLPLARIPIRSVACGAGRCESGRPLLRLESGLPDGGGPGGIPVSTSSHEVDLINNNIKTPYSDQFSIGFRTRLSRLGRGSDVSPTSRATRPCSVIWGTAIRTGPIYKMATQWGAPGLVGIGVAHSLG